MEPPGGDSVSLRRWAARKLEAAGIAEARLEAQLLLALALGVSRTAVIAGMHPEPTPEQQAEFERLVRERVRRAPLAYLRGTQEFYGLTFRVGPAVLIPRPETELLVEFALERLAQADAPLLADVGTGSGCIAVAALAHAPQARGVAFDISPDALALARGNAEAHGVAERLRFARADLLTAAGSGFVVILANPPYIPTAEMPSLQAEVRDFEPRLALDGGPDGLDFHRGLAAGARRALAPGGWLAVEVALGQAPQVAALMYGQDFRHVSARRDLAGIERIVCGQLTSPPARL